MGRPCFKADLLVTVLQTHHPLILKQQHPLSFTLFLPLSLPLSPITPATQFIHPTSVCLALISEREHYCPDAKVSGQGDKLEHTHMHTPPTHRETAVD